MNIAGWLVVLLANMLVLAVDVDWEELKQQLGGPGQSNAVKAIVKHWQERPGAFFQGIREDSCQKIAARLSTRKIEMIKPKEFKYSKTACRVFIKYLPHLSGIEKLPKVFRSAFYQQLSKDKGVQMGYLVRYIPVQWVEEDGRELTKALATLGEEALQALNAQLVAALLANFRGACEFITLDMLDNMSYGRINYMMKPRCVAAIRGLNKMNLSLVLWKLPVDSFSDYNGPLSKETLGKFTSSRLAAYGSHIREKSTICQDLELHLVPHRALSAISARCLHGYLSRKWNVGLGTGWSEIPIKVLLDFTPEMKLAWTNIHQDDYSKIPLSSRAGMHLTYQVCSTVDLSFFTPQVMSFVWQSCLYGILSRPEGKVALGGLWRNLPPRAFAVFTQFTVESFRNVDVADFVHIPVQILQMVFDSDGVLANLPSPINQIRISPDLEGLVLTAARFAAVAKAAPGMAGQILMYSSTLPEDIFAECDGKVLRSLEYVTSQGETLSWELLFFQLEGSKRSFGKCIKFISTRTDYHFCSTINTLSEYLLLPWLGRHMSDACRSALPFNISDASVLSKAPELAYKVIPWKDMLRVYSPLDWARMAEKDMRSHLFAKLGSICEFWISACEKVTDFLEMFGDDLEVIPPNCVHKLRGVLSNKCDVISSLADDAFALYKAGEFPCNLQDLSKQQISTLSTFNVKDLTFPTTKERSRHVLSRATTEELKLLSTGQFKALLGQQKIFIPEEVIKETVKLRFDSSIGKLNQLLANRVSMSKDAKNEDRKSSFVEALSEYAFIREQEHPVTDNLDISKLVEVSENSLIRKKIFNVISDYKWARGLTLVLCADVKELQKYIRKAIKDAFVSRESLGIPFSRETGFDRVSILQLVGSSPEALASAKASVTGGDVIDAGGPSRMLISQMLSDIRRDLVVPGPQISGVGSIKRARAEASVDYASNAKFVWGISRWAGLVAGLSLGKALQLKLKLPFALDPAFYMLLLDHSKEAVKKYYKVAYKKDISRFKEQVSQLRGTDTVANELAIESMTKPEHLRYTILSTKADASEAESDFASKTNVWACGEDEGFSSVRELKGKQFLPRYFKEILKKMLSEFRAFILQLVKGFGMAMPPVKEFKKIPVPALKPFTGLLAELLNRAPLEGKDILAKVRFTGDEAVPSLRQGEWVEASSVFSAFVLSLEERQLERLVGIWTGAPNISLDEFNLQVTFIQPGDIQSYKVDFYNGTGATTYSDSVVAPGEDYRVFFQKFAHNLLRSEAEVSPSSREGGVAIIPIRPSTCATDLMVYLQSAEEMLNSLVDLLYTSQTTLKG